ncbi:hypothetical protein OGAPHI_001216 [Ogataea philodendri]|uniref:Fibronectin type-III domain-containing protein n=1 Tax=Ogataea philodendri TaxID=1378263 RepID=A0A9P8TA42_9ASCO|nr:uncharacterized protein OGAPHI_001216 [Ogataea philodendri]KAH3670701.1 hypothetical protein OGAPHI_001216 [Ogataea philodendri]
MLIPIALAILGFLWLLHRLLLLLSLPLEKSIKVLNVSIPTVPLVSIDKVSHSSMVIHWDSPVDEDDADHSTDPVSSGPPILQHASPKTISHYVLYINGIQAAVINGDRHSCVINGLFPESNYQVDIVAFNMANFRSKSSPVHVKTGPNNMSELDHPDQLLDVLIPHDERETVTKKSTLRQTSPATRSRSNTADQENLKSRIHPHLITDIGELKFLLETGLDTVRSLSKASKELETDFLEEESVLIAARNEARERRKLEDQNRSSLRQEIKFLEETRMKTENRISSDQTKLETRRRKIQEKKSEMKQWKVLLAEKRAAKEKLEEREPVELETLKLQVEELNKEIFKLQIEVHDVEEDIKYDLANRKKQETLKQQLQALFEQLRTHTDTETGTLKPEGRTLFEELCKLRPDWEQDFKNEFSLDDQFDSQWKVLRNTDKEKIETLRQQVDEKHSRPSSQYENFGAFNDGSISNILSTAMNRMNTPLSYNGLSPEPTLSSSPPVWNSPINLQTNQMDMFRNLLDKPQSAESPHSHVSNFDFSAINYNDNMMFGLPTTVNPIIPGTTDDQVFPNGLVPGMSTSPSMRDSSKFFGSINSQRHIRSNGSSIDRIGTADSPQDPPPHLGFDLSRARSTSFGSSIWNNSANNSNWGSMNILNTPLNDEMTPKIYFESEDPMPKPSSNASSPSFLKTKLFKFGSSPTKTGTKSTEGDDSSVATDEELQSGSGSGSGSGPNSMGSGLLGSGFGSRSSRFFKLKKNQSEDSPLEPASDSSSSGNVLARRLSFAFKRGDKDKDSKGESVIEEEDED